MAFEGGSPPVLRAIDAGSFLQVPGILKVGSHAPLNEIVGYLRHNDVDVPNQRAGHLRDHLLHDRLEQMRALPHSGFGNPLDSGAALFEHLPDLKQKLVRILPLESEVHASMIDQDHLGDKRKQGRKIGLACYAARLLRVVQQTYIASM